MLGEFDSPSRGSNLYSVHSHLVETNRLQELQNRIKNGTTESKQYYNIRIQFAKKKETSISFVLPCFNQPKIGRTLFDEEFDDNEDKVGDIEPICLQSMSGSKALSRSNLENTNKSNIISIAASEVERAIEFDQSGIYPARSTNFFADPNNISNPADSDPVYKLSSFTGSGFLQTYCIADPIWKSSSSTVYRARHRYDCLFYAIKQVACEELLDAQYFSSIKKAANEIQLLDVLEHAHIVGFYTSWNEIGFTFIKLEYCVGKSLEDYFSRKRKLGISSASAIIEQVGSALDYMYSQFRVIHGKIDERSVLIQTRRRRFLRNQKSVEDIISEGEKCHKELESEQLRDVTFKLSNFGTSKKITNCTSESEVRRSDVIGVAKIVIKNSHLGAESDEIRRYVSVLRGKIKLPGYTAKAVLEYLDQPTHWSENLTQPEPMETF